MGNIFSRICKNCEEPPTSNNTVLSVPHSPPIPDNTFIGTIEEYIYYSNSPKNSPKIR